MRVLLVSLNAKYIHASPAPYALRAGIRAHGEYVRDADILDATVNQSEEELLAAISEKDPDILSFSCYIWNITLVLSLASRMVREGRRILLGGPEVSPRSREVLETAPFVDYILSGEGERSLPRLLDALAVGASCALPGVSFREAGRIVTIPEEEPLTPPPSPIDGGYLDALAGRIAYSESSRGCPFRCSFCLSGASGSVRFYDEARAIEELLRLAASGTRTVKLVDRTFNADPARAVRILDALIRAYGLAYPEGVTFHFEIEASLLNEETFAILERAPAGLFQFEIGLQSLHSQTLSAISRNRKTEHILTACRRIAASHRAHVHLDLIAGLPHETRKSFLSGFRLAYRAGAHMLQLGFLKVLHGSRIERECSQYGIRYHEEPPYEVVSTSTMSEEDILFLHRFEHAFDRLYNSGRHRRTLAYLTEDAGIDPVSLFARVGESLAEQPARGLDALTVRIYELFSDIRGVDCERLLDVMLLDRIATNRNTHLPALLYRRHPAIRRLREKNRGRELAFAPLSNGELWMADYAVRDPVTAEYPLTRLDLSEY